MKSWRPDTGDYDRRGEGELLMEALRRAGARGARPIEDTGGVCAYQTERTIIVAKKSTYGNLVSVAEHVVTRAKNEGLWIIMYLKSAEAFYKFDPAEIEEHVEFRNNYALERMLNFNIRLGRRVS